MLQSLQTAGWLQSGGSNIHYRVQGDPKSSTLAQYTRCTYTGQKTEEKLICNWVCFIKGFDLKLNEHRPTIPPFLGTKILLVKSALKSPTNNGPQWAASESRSSEMGEDLASQQSK